YSTSAVEPEGRWATAATGTAYRPSRTARRGNAAQVQRRLYMAFSWRSGWAALLPLMLALALAPAAFAQSSSTEERVRDLERQVEQLKAEIAAMKSGGE